MSDTSYLKRICEQIVGRIDSLDLRGKRAHDEALACMVGRAIAFQAIGDDEKCQHLGRVAGLIVAVRGMKAVREMAGD